MRGRYAVTSVMIVLACGAWIACSFPSVSFVNGDAGTDATLDTSATDTGATDTAKEGAKDAATDAAEDDATSDEPDFPDGDPDAYADGFSPCDQDHDKWKSAGCGGGDCNDLDPQVHPGADFHTEVHDGSPDWDWNCNGQPDYQYPSKVPCSGLVATGCSGGGGFGADVACGQTGNYIITCGGPPLGTCAATATDTRVQGCR